MALYRYLVSVQGVGTGHGQHDLGLGKDLAHSHAIIRVGN